MKKLLLFGTAVKCDTGHRVAMAAPSGAERLVELLARVVWLWHGATPVSLAHGSMLQWDEEEQGGSACGCVRAFFSGDVGRTVSRAK